MAIYMATRIIDRVYTFSYVISRRPDLRLGIEEYLKEVNREELIDVE